MSPRDRYDSLLRYYADQHGLDWRWLKAQMLAESAADPQAVSPVGALGLAQFMRATWAEWWDGTPGIQGAPPAWWNPTNPEAAIARQASYMAWLHRQFAGDRQKATAAYNWGIGKVKRIVYQRGWRDMLPRETRDYLARIEATYDALCAAPPIVVPT